eukprot:scaffold26101_cov60-Phaeocystis_antarctica.AAC.1
MGADARARAAAAFPANQRDCVLGVLSSQMAAHMVSPLLERGDNQRGDAALRERPEGGLSQGRPLSEADSFSDR